MCGRCQGDYIITIFTNLRHPQKTPLAHPWRLAVRDFLERLKSRATTFVLRLSSTTLDFGRVSDAGHENATLQRQTRGKATRLEVHFAPTL